MNRQKKNKIAASLVVVMACFAAFQNCTQQANSKKKEEVASSVSSSASAAISEPIIVEDRSSAELGISVEGETWDYAYDEAEDKLSIRYQNYDLKNKADGSSVFSASISRIFTSSYDGFEKSCQWNAIRGVRKSDSKTIEYIVMACAGDDQNRIYLSVNKRNLTDRSNFTNNKADGVLCFKSPCPVSTRKLHYDGQGGSNWSHFVMLEDNGELRAYSSRLNMKLYPIFARRTEQTLSEGTVSTVQQGHVQNPKRDYEVRLDYTLNSRVLKIGHQTFFLDTQSSSDFQSQGELRL